MNAQSSLLCRELSLIVSIDLIHTIVRQTHDLECPMKELGKCGTTQTILEHFPTQTWILGGKMEELWRSEAWKNVLKVVTLHSRAPMSHGSFLLVFWFFALYNTAKMAASSQEKLRFSYIFSNGSGKYEKWSWPLTLYLKIQIWRSTQLFIAMVFLESCLCNKIPVTDNLWKWIIRIQRVLDFHGSSCHSVSFENLQALCN